MFERVAFVTDARIKRHQKRNKRQEERKENQIMEKNDGKQKKTKRKEIDWLTHEANILPYI